MSSPLLTIYTDGGSRNNPGQAAIGGVAALDSQMVYEFSQSIGIATNNVAEYSALLYSIEWVCSYLAQHPDMTVLIEWRLDSQLVVEQVNKRWKVKDSTIKTLVEQVWTKLATLTVPYTIKYVPRAENKRADQLVNQALDNLQ